jgi:uncharacterized protein (TIGR01244 family)
MRQLEEGMFVAGQIRPEDVPEFAARGIRTIVNNRPDGEAPGQPEGAAIARAAEAAGIAYAAIPVTRLTSDAVDEMRAVLERADGPVLAFCAVGARSTYLWALARAGELDADELEVRAAEAGYDLAPIRPYLA